MDQDIGDNRFVISVVAPLYNEEENVRPFLQRLKGVFDGIGCDWEVVFALDPSPDRTEEVVKDFIHEGFPIRLIKFSRRIGKPLSLLAGLKQSEGDATVVIDVDLQDPPELIPDMIRKWQEGYQVVLAQRSSRRGENFFYLMAARLFYWLVSKFAEYPIPSNTGDFRLLDRRVVQALRECNERHAFLRGLTAAVGFNTAVVPFSRDKRHSGHTNISVWGAVNIALDGLIPFSRVPVRIFFVLGVLLTFIGLVGITVFVGWSWWRGISREWPFVMLVLVQFVIGGIAIAGLGVVGEYVARIYEEVRRRPLYVVESVVESQALMKRRQERALSSESPLPLC